MKRSLLLIAMLVVSCSLLLAQQGERNARPSIEQLQAAIQAELETHGDRVMGQETVHWSTRLDMVSDCRAQFSVHVSSRYGENTARTETVRLSFGALEPYEIAIQKSWLDLPCAGGEKCVYSTSTCSQKTKSGMITDCGTASQTRSANFMLQLDGDPAASARLQQTIRELVNQCRAPKAAGF